MISNYFKSLNPEQKKSAVKISIVVVGIVLALVGYYTLKGKRKPLPVKRTETKNINIDPNLLEKSLFAESRKDISRKEEDIKQLKEELERLKNEVSNKSSVINGNPQTNIASSATTVAKPVDIKKETPAYPPGVPNAKYEKAQGQAIPPPVMISDKHNQAGFPANKINVPPPPAGFPKAPQASNQGAQGNPPGIIGGIGLLNQPEKKTDDKQGTDKHPVNPGKPGSKIFLPPSFMEANLLSGVNAPTLEAAKSQPRPVFLRIKDLAILPNSVKADLKGCFVIAEGNGDLSDERVHLRLVTLSCLTNNGEAVISSAIKGFVIDSDGIIGLKGNVVTKMGALLGRSVIAGFFGGIGDAVNASTQTTFASSLGTTTTVDTDKILAAGLGNGLSTGFGKLQDFYLEMARQTFPVIEVGATKTVTIVISEGVDLTIRETCTGGLEECQEKSKI